MPKFQNYVDDRIVSMQFDNSEFDPNIKKSQKTLEEFEKSLDTKKFEKYADTLNKTDMSGLEKAFTGLGNSFKAFETIAVGALLNVGAKIENFVASSLKRMTVDPVAQGWSAYGENIGSVQTIMAATRNQFQAMADAIERGDEAMKGLVDSTGQLYTATSIMEEQMGYVNKQLDELMSFTDETSASYQVMVNNIGKFTSQNIDLKTSVKAMEGIATWANLSGANAEQMSRAMYNISQSLGVGRMLTRDWMSIENANMATVEFKNTVLETAASLGKLKKDSNGAFKTLKGNLVTVSNFRDTLSDDWLTSDVLIGALSTYGGFSQEIIALSQKTNKAVSELLYDAIEPISKGTKTVNQAIEELGINFEEIDISADDLKETLTKLASAEYDLGKRAFAASYESKTLADAVNYVGDAIKTGWVKTYQYIIGDYKEAKELWTEFAEILYTLFVRAGELRNEVLQIWKALGGRQDLLDGLKNIWEIIQDIGSIIRDVLGEFFPEIKDTEKGVNSLAAIFVAFTRKFKEFTQKIKESKPYIEAVTSGARILGNVIKGILEIARLLYVFLGPTVRFTKELFSNTMKLIKPISEGVDEVSDLKNVVEGLRIAFLILGTAVALPIKILSIFFNKISEIGNMTLPELLDKIKGWARGVWDSIKGLFTRSIELAKNVVDGFKNGFSNGFKALGDFIKGVFLGLIEIVKKVLGIHSPSTIFFAIGAFVIAGLILGIASMSDQLKESLVKVIGIFKDFASALVQIAMIIIVGIAVFKVINAITGIATGISNMFKSIGTFFSSAGKALKTYAKQKFKADIIKAIGQTALEIAISVAIIATAVLAIAMVSQKLNPGSLDKAMGIVGISAGILAGFMVLLGVFVTIIQKFNKKGTAKIGGSLFEKLGVDLGTFTYYSNTATQQMRALGASLIQFGIAVGFMVASVIAIAKVMKNNDLNIGDLLGIEGLLLGLTVILSGFLGLEMLIKKAHLFSGKTNTMSQLNAYLWMAVGVINTMAASLTAMAVIMASNHISIGTMLAIEGMLSAIPGVLGGFLALQLFIKKNNLFNTSKNNTFSQLVKYLWTAISAIAAVSTILIILSKMEVSWNAVAQLLTITAIIAAFSFAVLGLAMIIQKMNIPFAVLGKVALIVGVAVTAILTLTVSLALLGPALSMLVDGMEKFEPYLMKFNENADTLMAAMGKFILFSFMLSVASVFLSVAFVNIGIGLSTFIPIIIALIGLGVTFGYVFKSFSDAFDKAIDNIVKSAKTFLKNYKLLETALEAFKRLMTWDLAGPIVILIALSFALTSLGIAGWVAAGGLTLLILNAKLAALCINDLKTAMSFFETITLKQIAGMIELAFGIGALGLAATLTAPGIATLAVSVLLVAAAIYVLSASVVLLGNNMNAANAMLEFLIEHTNDFIKLLMPAEAIMTGLGIALALMGIGSIILAIGLTLTAVATLALIINFGIAILLLLAFNAVMNKISEDNPKLYDSIMDVVSAIGDIATSVANFFKVLEPFVDFVNRVVTKIPDAFIESGINCVQGFMDGISKVNTLAGKVTDFATSIVSWFNGVLRIESPSKVFHDSGVNSIDGYIEGIEDRKAYAKWYMQKTGRELSDSFTEELTLSQRAKDMTFEEVQHERRVRQASKTAAQEYDLYVQQQDKTFIGAIKNIGKDIGEIWNDVKSGKKTIGEGFQALFASLKEHGGTFLGDKIDALKDMLFGKDGPLSGLSDLLKNPFENLGLDNIMKSIKDLDLTDTIENLDFSASTDNVTDVASAASSATTRSGNSQYIFTQNNYSPKALSRLEIYRQTNRQFQDFRVREVLGK